MQIVLHNYKIRYGKLPDNDLWDIGILDTWIPYPRANSLLRIHLSSVTPGNHKAFRDKPFVLLSSLGAFAMDKQTFLIESIPAIVWGPPSENVYIFVHGAMSRKEDAAGFAEIAGRKGYQVLSFDLPEHGERKTENYPCTAQNGVRDLQVISKFVRNKWKHISLFASSLGAYFSLVAYQDLQFGKCLFLSPILDMQHLIRNMMRRSNVSEELLQEKQEISTSTGETLSWPYYAYVREHPVLKWQSQTHILYGSDDHVTERYIVDHFVTTFQCELEVLQNGEHYFHTKEQLEVVDQWLNQNI